MARPPGRRAPAEGPDLEGLLGEVRAGRPAPVYLLVGDPFLTLRAARRLVEELVPVGQRSLNLVELDAATSPGEVAAELATGGLFGGAKVVLLQEPAFLQSKEDAGEAFERARDLWAEGRHREAARRLVALAAKAGWGAADLDPGAGERAGKERREWGEAQRGAWKREMGLDLAEADLDFLAGAARYAVERDLRTARDDAAPLDALLEAGLPPARSLVVAAGKIDARLPLVKRLAAAGRRLRLAVEQVGTWDDQRPDLAPVIAMLLEGTGRSVDRAAEERLAELLGGDVRALALELGKLSAYAGDRKVIRVEDVDALVVRTAEDPFFALGNAVEARDLGEALAVLRRSLADGSNAPMLVASLAGTVRRLLVERERGRVAARGKRISSFPEWQALVLPSIPAEELGKRKPYGLWMKYQASMRFSREELLEALAALAEADHAMKTGAEAELLLERFLLGLLGPREGERRTA
jgi:DNA polymerase-3 subunit delta